MYIYLSPSYSDSICDSAPKRMSSSATGLEANSSISFLQAEHSETLKGLHSEIHKLQQKCASELTRCVYYVILSLNLFTGLTFELTMAGGNALGPKQGKPIMHMTANTRINI